MFNSIICFFRRSFFRVEYSEIKTRLYVIEMHLGLMFYNEKVLKLSKAKYDIGILNPILEVIHKLKSEREELLLRLSKFESQANSNSKFHAVKQNNFGAKND